MGSAAHALRIVQCVGCTYALMVSVGHVCIDINARDRNPARKDWLQLCMTVPVVAEEHAPFQYVPNSSLLLEGASVHACRNGSGWIEVVPPPPPPQRTGSWIGKKNSPTHPPLPSPPRASKYRDKRGHCSQHHRVKTSTNISGAKQFMPTITRCSAHMPTCLDQFHPSPFGPSPLT